MPGLAEPFDRARLKAGENRLPCPDCDRGERDRALSVRLEADGRALWHCHRCGFRGASDGELRVATANKGRRATRSAQETRTAPAPARELSAWALNLWRASMPLDGPALAYLKARACAIPPEGSDLRWLPCLSHPTGYKGPALLARVTDAATGTPITLHRTWIRADGRKANADPPRLLLKDHAKAGGVVRLWPDDAIAEGLGIAEGIETALSLAHGFAPVWAAIDAGNLADFAVLDGIGALVIAADHDRAGLEAADKCAARWTAAGRSVRIVTPARVGSDLNDQVREWAT